MEIGQFFVRLGVKADSKPLQKFKGFIEELPNKVFNLKNALTILGVIGMDKFVESTVTSTTALENFNMQTGLSIDKLQKWQRAAQLANIGMEAEDVTSSIQGLQNALTNIRLGHGNIQPFAMLGIDPTGKDAFEILEKIRQRIKTISPSVATNLLSQMGINPNMINVLRLTRGEFEKLSQTQYLSPRQRENIMEMGIIKELKLNIMKMKDFLVADLKPAFDMVLHIIGSAGKAFGFLAENVLESKIALTGLGLLVGGWWYKFHPIITAITTLLTLLDSLMSYFKGEDTSIDKMINSFSPPEKGEKKKEYFKDALDFVSGGLQDTWNLLTKGQAPQTATAGGNVTINQTIHSNATDNKEVAKESSKNIIEYMKAKKQIGDGSQ